MQKLIFKNLLIKGFGSIQENLELKLNNGKLNLIKGVNGTGKSSIINAFFWCLYGETLKEKSSVELWKHLRDNNYKGVYVEVSFKKGGKTYRIIRMKGYSGKVEGARGSSRLLLYTDGDLYKIEDKKEVQKYIIETLGINADVLKNSVVFGQKVSRITQEKGVKRKDILDNLFDLSYINSAKVDAQADLNEQVETLSELENKLSSIELNISNTEANLEDINEFNQKVSENLKKALEENKKDIKIANADKKELIKKEASIIIPERAKVKTFKTINVDKSKLLELSAKLNVHKVKVENLSHDLRNVISKCPECGRPFDATEVKKQRNRYRKEIDKSSVKTTALKNRIQAEESRLKSLAYKAKAIEKKKNSYEDKVKGIESERERKSNEKAIFRVKIKQLDKDIHRLELEKTKIKDRYSLKDTGKLDKILSDLKSNKSRLERKINIKRDKVDRLKWIVNDALSNKGMKAFIFSFLLSSINEKLLEYEDISGFGLRFDVGDNTKRDINIQVIRDGHLININDLSGGQKQLLDITSIFAIHDVLQQDMKVKTMFLDEVFESLSEENIDKVDDLISMKLKQGITVFLITHLKEYNPVNSELLQLELENGLTKVAK